MYTVRVDVSFQVIGVSSTFHILRCLQQNRSSYSRVLVRLGFDRDIYIYTYIYIRFSFERAGLRAERFDGRCSIETKRNVSFKGG